MSVPNQSPISPGGKCTGGPSNKHTWALKDFSNQVEKACLHQNFCRPSVRVSTQSIPNFIRQKARQFGEILIRFPFHGSLIFDLFSQSLLKPFLLFLRKGCLLLMHSLSKPCRHQATPRTMRSARISNELPCSRPPSKSTVAPTRQPVSE